jgi:Flp pilus assembly protein TadB
MTRETGREHEQDQHGLAAAYTYAATAHDQAAQMHEKVAEHYDKRGKAARAMHERRMAAQERRSAVADRKWVANLTAETGGEIGSSSDESDRPGPHGADLAALIGATIAVLLTLTSTPGAWGYLSTLIGLLLLIILLAFFWRRRPPIEKGASSAEQRNNWKSFSAGKIGNWSSLGSPCRS